MLHKAVQKALQHVSGGRAKCYAIATDKRGRILAEAGNNYCKTSSKQARIAKSVGMEERIYLHAECAVIAKLSSLRKKAHSLYVARVKVDGSVGNAKPCVVCELAIQYAEIKHTFYTT